MNRRFVAMYFTDEDPIGRRIRLTGDDAGEATRWLTIVGVSPTVRQQYLRELDPVVYLPYRAEPGAFMAVMARASANPGAIPSLLRDTARALDPDVPVYGLVSMEELRTQSRWGHRVFGTIFAVVAFIALALSAVSLYAVTAYSVTQRTHEIGIRMALGARAREVLWLVGRRVSIQVAIGLVLGMTGAFGVGRLLQSLLVQTSPSDPITLASIAVLLTVVSLAACYGPARRATRVDPVLALRHE